MSTIRNFAKKIKRKIKPISNKNLVDLKSVPPEYQALVKKIMINSPIWGSHQTIEFPNGYILQGGRDQSRLTQFDLPKDLTGNTVLDIGCNIGGVSLECKKRNADHVTGMDLSEKLLDCAKGLSEIWGFGGDFRQVNIGRDNIDEKFDYVFFLNVFHHLDETGKIKALKTLDKITTKRLFFEAPIGDDVIAGEHKWLKTEDYVSYFKGFTNFSKVEVSGMTDFGRPLITCDR